MESTAIYGIFNRRGICLYVGATCDPKRRWFAHTNPVRGKFVRSNRMRIFRWVNNPWDAGRIERQVIRAFWRRGQAERNSKRNAGYAPPASLESAPPICRIVGGPKFPTWAAVARFTGASATTISNNVQNYDGTVLGKNGRWFKVKLV